MIYIIAYELNIIRRATPFFFLLCSKEFHFFFFCDRGDLATPKILTLKNALTRTLGADKMNKHKIYKIPMYNNNSYYGNQSTKRSHHLLILFLLFFGSLCCFFTVVDGDLTFFYD